MRFLRTMSSVVFMDLVQNMQIRGGDIARWMDDDGIRERTYVGFGEREESACGA